VTARILIVDDSESIRETLGLTLRFKGYEVQEAENGEQALKILQQDVFDLVFCDLAMPGMDGREVIRRLRKQPGLENLPVLVLSAEARETKAESLEAGATACIDKPFSPETILRQVEQCLAK